MAGSYSKCIFNLCAYIFPPAEYENSSFSTSLPTLVSSVFLILHILISVHQDVIETLICIFLWSAWASLVAQLVKNPPAMRETWVRSLGWEGPLEKGMATHSSFLAQRIPMDRGAWWDTLHGVAKSQAWLSDWAQHSTFSIFPWVYLPPICLLWWNIFSNNLLILVLAMYLICCYSVAQLCPTLCNPMDCSMPGLARPYYWVLKLLSVFWILSSLADMWFANILFPSVADSFCLLIGVLGHCDLM